VTLTINVQSAAGRAAFNIGTQTDVTNVQPTTGALDKLADKELWLSVGATAWENAQLTLRRIRPRDTQPTTYAYVRNADPARPVKLRDVKALGCNGLKVSGLTPTWDSYGSTLFWATVDGVTYGSAEIHCDGFIVGARTKLQTLNTWPDAFKFESTRTFSVTNTVADCIMQLVKVGGSSTTHTICDAGTITNNQARRFRNNGVFIGGGHAGFVCDSITIEDNVFIEPSQYDIALHPDCVQLSGNANTGVVSNIVVRRNIGAVLGGLSRMQFFFGRTDAANDNHTNITVEGNIGLIGAVWGAYDGPGAGKIIRGNLFIYDPNNFGADGLARSLNLGGGVISAQITNQPRIGFYDYPTDSRWSGIIIDNNILQNDPNDYLAIATVTNNVDLPMTAADPNGFAALTTLFNDPASLRKDPSVWAAMTVAQIKTEIVRCLKPKAGSSIATIGPLTTDGQWRYGGEYIPPVDVPEPPTTPTWTEIPANDDDWTPTSIATGTWTQQPIAAGTWS
jgi:hypothetical protein